MPCEHQPAFGPDTAGSIAVAVEVLLWLARLMQKMKGMYVGVIWVQTAPAHSYVCNNQAGYFKASSGLSTWTAEQK